MTTLIQIAKLSERMSTQLLLSHCTDCPKNKRCFLCKNRICSRCATPSARLTKVNFFGVETYNTGYICKTHLKNQHKNGQMLLLSFQAFYEMLRISNPSLLRFVFIYYVSLLSIVKKGFRLIKAQSMFLSIKFHYSLIIS